MKDAEKLFCKKCLKIWREYNAEKKRQQRYRLKIKQVGKVKPEIIKIKIK